MAARRKTTFDKRSGGEPPKLTLISPPEQPEAALAEAAKAAHEAPEVPAAEPPAAPLEPVLSALAQTVPPVAPRESIAQRVRRLQAEAQSLARQQILELQTAMRQVAEIAEEVADGGDAYPVGARELAGRLADDLIQKTQTLGAIIAKKG